MFRFFWKTKQVKEHLKNHPHCAVCGYLPKFGHNEVHHIIPVSVDPSLKNDPENLVTLCHHCHKRFGHFSNWKYWNPDLRKITRNFSIGMEMLSAEIAFKVNYEKRKNTKDS